MFEVLEVLPKPQDQTLLVHCVSWPLLSIDFESKTHFTADLGLGDVDPNRLKRALPWQKSKWKPARDAFPAHAILQLRE